jgi:hypothetical protein
MKFVFTARGEDEEAEYGFCVGIINGVLRRSWIKERFLRGGGGEKFGRGGAKLWRGGVGKGEWRLEEPFEVRLISSQPLFRGAEVGDEGTMEWVFWEIVSSLVGRSGCDGDSMLL